MAKYGCLPRFIAMMRQFHEGMQACVQNDGENSEPSLRMDKDCKIDKFTYLRSGLFIAVHIDDEGTVRTVKTSVASGRLRGNICEWNGIKLDTQLKVYKAVVLTTLVHVYCYGLTCI